MTDDKATPRTPNIDAALQGCVSGNISEWPAIRVELQSVKDYTECLRAELERVKGEVDELRAERDRCHARLEIDHCYVSDPNWKKEDGGTGLMRKNLPLAEHGKFPDAIDCRDETIKLLKKALKEAGKGEG